MAGDKKPRGRRHDAVDRAGGGSGGKPMNGGKRIRVLVIDPDGEAGSEIATLIAPFGYEAILCDAPEEAGEAIARATPAHVLLRLRAESDNRELLRRTAAAVAAAEPRPSLVFIADDSSVPARIAAVRAGADAYLTPPLNGLSLVDRLDGLRGALEAEPYRIMIVDDDALMAQYHAELLQSAGMTVEVVKDPFTVMRHLADFRPELILMDHYMPDIQGSELAAVIRQEAAFDSIPIVFLSAEDDAETQDRMMATGGDDFLTKSIKPQHLVSAIANRTRRFRALRATMLRDSLTGLLNHTATKEQLDADIARMKRAGQPLTLCMLDLDHFKQVNDAHGHPAGDRVLRALAHLLKQRLRASDVVGRFGGEEFAIAMPNTTPRQAAQVVDEIRESFAALRQTGETGAFSVAFSAGLADYPTAPDSAALTEAADRALYRAKAAGRNRVAIAEAADYPASAGAPAAMAV